MTPDPGLSLQSVSYSDWLNSLVTCDNLGEVILAVLPQISSSTLHIKRTLERRLVSRRRRRAEPLTGANRPPSPPQPVYFTFLVPHDANKEGMGGGEEGGGGGGRNGSGGAAAEEEPGLPLRVQTYREAAESFYLQHSDNNMVGAAAGSRAWKLPPPSNSCHMTSR